MHVRRSDVALMRLALDAARGARDEGEVPIGTVIAAADGSIVATAGNRRERDTDPTAHAELLALRAAAAARGTWHLADLTLVVTLEPCAMCAGAIGLARIPRVVFGAWNPDYGALGSVWDVLRSPRRGAAIEVVAGVLEAQCSELLSNFFAQRR